ARGHRHIWGRILRHQVCVAPSLPPRTGSGLTGVGRCPTVTVRVSCRDLTRWNKARNLAVRGVAAQERGSRMLRTATWCAVALALCLAGCARQVRPGPVGDVQAGVLIPT